MRPLLLADFVVDADEDRVVVRRVAQHQQGVGRQQIGQAPLEALKLVEDVELIVLGDHQ